MGFISGIAQGLGAAVICTYVHFEVLTLALAALGGNTGCVPRTLVVVMLLSAALGSCASHAAAIYIGPDGAPRRGAAGTLIGGLLLVQALGILAVLMSELSILSAAVLATAFACGHIIAAAAAYSAPHCVLLSVPVCAAAAVALLPSDYIDEAVDSGFDTLAVDMPAASEYPEFQLLNTGHSVYSYPAAAAVAHGIGGSVLLFSVSRTGRAA